MSEIVLDPSQTRAVEAMLCERIAIVTGGPGTGKTTTLRTALDRLDALPAPRCPECGGRGQTARVGDLSRLDPDGSCPRCDGSGEVARYLLAAPTGKAARRMEEATGRASRTVHRLLEFVQSGPRGPGFARNSARPLACDAVFIDESSMLDTELAAALFDAVDPETTRLILIGDANQLPSVGPGRVFADLIDSGIVPVARLTQLHRAAAESWVCSQAPRVLAGDMPDVSARPDFGWIECAGRDAAVCAVVDAARKPGTQVLVPQNVGPAGADVLNARLQAALNPDGVPAWKIRNVEMRLGDAVIQTKNDYSIGVMNGETGRIVAADKDQLVVDFGESGAPREVCYDRDRADGLRLAYALTVHKSQGSEWPWVVMLCHSTHARMLTRQLFYTAITRAKKGVILVGDRRGLEYAVHQTRDADRLTALKERLVAEAQRAGIAA